VRAKALHPYPGAPSTGLVIDSRYPDSGSPRTKLRQRVLLAVSVGALVAGAAFGGYVILVHPSQGEAPAVRVSTIGLAGHSFADTTVQIFSWVPSTAGQGRVIDLRGANPASNPYEVELYRGTTDALGQASGSLGAEFSAVNAGWMRTITPLTGQVSMSILATHTEIVNGALYEYSYFNNIPYNPRSPPSQFNVAITFDWSHPSAVLSLASLGAQDVHTECIPNGHGGCQPTCPPTWYWGEVNESSTTGPLPVAMGNLSYHQSQSALTYGVSYYSNKMNLAFNSNDWQSSQSAVGMSTQPSWNGTDMNGVSDIDQAFSNDTLPWGMIYLDNVTYHVVNYEFYVDGGTYPNCHYIDQNIHRTDVSISNVQSTSFVFKAIPVNPDFAKVLLKFFKFSAFNKTYEAPGAPSIKLYSVIQQATGYTNAQDALHKVVDAISYFDAALSLGLAAADAMGWLPIIGEAGDVAATIGIIASEVGFATAVITEMMSISFSVTEQNSIEMIDYAVYGAPNSNGLYLTFYQATQASFMTTPSGTYNANMPPTYVVASQS